ncbi:hypothetical protein HMPREF0290_0109, partial [Corynebacterium efficiens YS-314]
GAGRRAAAPGRRPVRGLAGVMLVDAHLPPSAHTHEPLVSGLMA